MHAQAEAASRAHLTEEHRCRCSALRLHSCHPAAPPRAIHPAGFFRSRSQALPVQCEKSASGTFRVSFPSQNEGLQRHEQASGGTTGHVPYAQSGWLQGPAWPDPRGTQQADPSSTCV